MRDLLKPFHDFLRMEAAGGLMLMAGAVAAMLIANSPFAAGYIAWLELPVTFSFGSFGLNKPLLLWINDGLMAVFFLLVGLELKRELLEGHLSSVQRAALPGIAAIGGMVAPALIYLGINWGDPQAMRGWAIPTATDIAFALGVLSLLGKRVPTALKALLLSIAIFDDLGAILVIAIFYTDSLSVVSLLTAGAAIVALYALNRSGSERPSAYVVVGIILWLAVLKSGVHATLAGVVLAMFIPLRSKGVLRKRGNESLLHHLEHALHPWVAFGVLPLFAFANAGVSLLGIQLTDVFKPIPLGVLLGLFVGKQFGVLSIIWLARKLRIAALAPGLSWGHVYGMALLSGIGFTMSLFVSSLAFPGEASPAGGLERLGVLIGTVLSGIAGYVVLRMSSGGQRRG